MARPTQAMIRNKTPAPNKANLPWAAMSSKSLAERGLWGIQPQRGFGETKPIRPTASLDRSQPAGRLKDAKQSQFPQRQAWG